MSTITRQPTNVYTICELPTDRIYALCRFVEFPREARSHGDRIRHVQRHYGSYTGRELPVWDAIRIYDRIVAERDDVPFPKAYSRIADLLFREDYSVDAIHQVVGHLRRGGTVATCPCLEPADRAAVSDLLPRAAAPCRTAD